MSEASHELDQIGWQILDAVQKDGRISYSELGRQVGLSAPAVAERIKRLEETGIIRQFRALADPEKLGWPVKAFVKLKCAYEFIPRVEALAAEVPEIMECYHVTGEDSFIMKVAVPSVGALEKLISRMRRYGQPDTSVILSTTVHPKLVVGVRPEPETVAAE